MLWCLFQLLKEFYIQHGSTYRKCVIVKFSGQPSQSGGNRKGIVLICLTLCLQLIGTSHEIQIPSNEPQQKTYFQQTNYVH